MAGPGGREDPVVARALVEAPEDFEFLQAVRLLAAAARWQGRRAGPRLHASDALAYPAAEVEAVEPDGGGRAALATAVMGLTGPLGVLPQHYTELLHASRRAHNPALGAFLDLFNDRLLTLFAAAAAKYCLPLAFEGAPAGGPDPITALLQALVGIQGMAIDGELGHVPDPTALLLHHAGHFSQRRASAAALEAVLADELGVPVRVDSYQGAWLPIPVDEQSRLGDPDGPPAFCTLGVDAVAGERVWDVQSRFRVVLGPLDYRTFRQLLPDGPLLARAVGLARFLCGAGMAIEVSLRLDAPEVPACRMGGSAGYAPHLGWNTWPAGARPEEKELCLING
jgi:type VI secretion system protein ImpH